MTDNDEIPTAEVYRGTKIHAFQPAERIATIVRPAIDAVLEMSDCRDLFKHVTNPANPPESKMLAAARCEALWELAAENREPRPDVDLAVIRSCIAGLDCRHLMSRDSYTAVIQPQYPAIMRRERPLTDEEMGRA
jgi:hypothetical protein